MVESRVEFEAVELERLASYAMPSCRSKGRKYLEQEPPYRSVFARDRDRVIHTTAFRRLEYKTQVFVNSEGDHYRTRLTHTLEVAQIGRSIARALRANEDLVEAIALAHDLGHTPFGHAGEQVLNEIMADHGGFDHNRQSLRIVEELEKRYPNFPGLNLTWEVREGIIKHQTDYDQSCAAGFDPELQGTLESQIVNVADEIAYNTHDLDDGLRAGLLTPLTLKDVVLWQELIDHVNYRPGDAFEDLIRYGIVRHLVGLEVEDVITHTARQLEEGRIDSLEKVRHFGRNLVEFSPQMTEKNRQLKECLLNNFYLDYRLIRRTTKARHILERLFEAYSQEPRQLPGPVQSLLKTRSLQRVICDYIAGMTDRFAAQEYSKLFESSDWIR